MRGYYGIDTAVDGLELARRVAGADSRIEFIVPRTLHYSVESDTTRPSR